MEDFVNKHLIFCLIVVIFATAVWRNSQEVKLFAWKSDSFCKIEGNFSFLE